jgi:tRNA1(Val) A37 N6-methylase TrmN6
VIEQVTDDLFYGGRLRLLQPKKGHRIGGDAALLVAAARSRMADGFSVADFGAGVGAMGLALAACGAGRAALVEIDPGLAELARQNAERNGLSDQVAVLCGDVADLGRDGAEGWPGAETVDLVVSNPPFDDSRRFRTSPDPAKALAHAEGADLPEVWIAAAARLLRPGGSLVMIHRPEALARLLPAAEGRFGDLRLKPVHAREGAPASRVLLAGRKGRRGPLALLPGLTMHGPGGEFSAEAEAAQRGASVLAMG